MAKGPLKKIGVLGSLASCAAFVALSTMAACADDGVNPFDDLQGDTGAPTLDATSNVTTDAGGGAPDTGATTTDAGATTDAGMDAPMTMPQKDATSGGQDSGQPDADASATGDDADADASGDAADADAGDAADADADAD